MSNVSGWSSCSCDLIEKPLEVEFELFRQALVKKL